MGGFQVLAACILIAVWFIRFFKQGPKLPPGPWNLPVIGSLYLLGKLPHVSLKKLSAKHGEIMYLKLGSTPFFVFSSASMAKEIFGVHSVQFASKRSTVAGRCLWEDVGIVFSSYTPQYRLLKKVLVAHLLSTAKLRIYEGVRRQGQLEMVKSLFELSEKVVMLKEKFHCLNMNVITMMLFGEKYSGSKVAKFDLFMSSVFEALKLCSRSNISDYFPAIGWLDVQGIERQLNKMRSVVEVQLLEIVNEHRVRKLMSPADSRCFVDALLSLEGVEKLPDASIVALVFDVLLGAVDTSAAASEWALTELLRHPSKLEKARMELEQVLGDNSLVQESDLPKLPYIEAIAKETLRLHPVGPMLLPREVTSSCTIKGYEVPAGMGVIVNLSAILLDEKHWKNALEFYPERFIEQNVDVFGSCYDLVPFGTGRRRCPGAELGYDTLRLVIATLVQAFDWTVPSGAGSIDTAEAYGLVSCKAEPLVAIPTPRLPIHAYLISA